MSPPFFLAPARFLAPNVRGGALMSAPPRVPCGRSPFVSGPPPALKQLRSLRALAGRRPFRGRASALSALTSTITAVGRRGRVGKRHASHECHHRYHKEGDHDYRKCALHLFTSFPQQCTEGYLPGGPGASA